jgi:hypothetical protein
VEGQEKSLDHQELLVLVQELEALQEVLAVQHQVVLEVQHQVVLEVQHQVVLKVQHQVVLEVQHQMNQMEKLDQD